MIILRCYFCHRRFNVRWVTLDRLALIPHAVACTRCGALPSASPRNLIHYDYGYARGDARQYAGVRFIAAERLAQPGYAAAEAGGEIRCDSGAGARNLAFASHRSKAEIPPTRKINIRKATMPLSSW